MGRQRHTIAWKLGLAFVLITVVIMLITLVLNMRSVDAIRTSVYNEMLNNVAYYQQSLDDQIGNIKQLQIEFFKDRKLPYLSGRENLLSEYERREAFLSLQERLGTITGISRLVQDGVVYFPKTGYRVTDSRIDGMSETDRAAVDVYLARGDSTLYYDGDNFVIARTGEARQGFSGNPDQLFVLTFSSAEVERQLARLIEGGGGGAFVYEAANDAMLERSNAAVTGREILSMLARDAQDEYVAMQRVRVKGQSYLVLARPSDELGLVVQYTPEKALTQWIRETWLYIGCFLAGMIAFAILFIMYVKRIVHRPLAVLSTAFSKVEAGDLNEHIYHDGSDEFGYIYQRFNDMEDHLKRLIDEVYVQKNLTQRAQLKQLQAQINPHFLYNSFFILSRRIHREDIEGAEELAAHLGDYFKYLSRDQSDDIPLLEEVNHARSYAAIQATRFAGRLSVAFDALPEAWNDLRVPRLILQPILENAFKYGLENRSENGLLRVAFTEAGECLEISVEDNGEETVDPAAMQAAIEREDASVISGLTNIHRRLQIYFHGCGGLRVQRSALGGVGVVVVLPRALPEEGEGEK